jgi:MFS family permease
LRHRNFRLYAAGMLVSLSGTWMQQLAQSWLVYRLTHSEWILGLAWFCSNVPVLLLAPVAGMVADRYPRRRIVLAAQAAGMLQALTLAVLTLTGVVAVWHILALALLLGVASAFDIPGRQSLFVQLVGTRDLLSAISLNSVIFNATRVVGPSLGGLIVARVGEGPAFLINAASFLAVLGSLAAMRIPAETAARTFAARHTFREGLAYVWSSRPLRTVLCICGTVSLAASPALVLAPVFAGGIFGQGSQGLGFLTGAMGAGAVGGVMMLAHRTRLAGLPRVVMVSTALMGLSLMVYAVSPSFLLCLAMMPLIGLGIMRQNAAANTMVQSSLREEFRGRVMGLYTMMVIGAIPIGSLLCGALAARIGPRATTFLGGLLCLAASATAARWQRKLRLWLAPAVERTPA